MRGLNQWVVWRFEKRDGKLTKVPYSPLTGRRAGSTDPKTWTGYCEAVKAARGKDYDGLGFVFTADDPYVGVDLDGCRDPATGEVEGWAREIIEELGSYAEISPSGTGVHVILEGGLPPGRNRKGNIELYDRARFFTMTGKHLPHTPKTIEGRQEALRSVVGRVFGVESPNDGHGRPHRGSGGALKDDELVRLASEADDGGKFRELFEGGYCGLSSHSEAAASLLFKLAFWSDGDAKQMERIFRRSGLMYEKFDSRRGNTTWGAQEIQQAISKVGEGYAPAGEKFVVLGKESSEDGVSDEAASPGVLLSDVAPEKIDWLWPGRLPRGKVVLLDGDPGLGKSLVTLDLAARVSAGRGWPDGGGCEPDGVVLLSAEDGLADTIRPRFDAAGGVPARAVALSTVPDTEGNERQIAIPHDLGTIEAAIERVGAVLVVIDPLAAFLAGDVNSHRDQDVRRALAPLARLAERTGAAVVVVRHLNKASGGNALYRGGGSIGIVGAARMAFVVGKDTEDEERRVLAPIKSNLAAPAPSLVFGLEPAENGAPRVAWRGQSTLDASALLSAPTDPEERSVLQEARDLLRDALSDGPVPASDVKREARSADISERTLKTAKRELGVFASREGESGKRGGGRWLWALPNPPSRIKGANPNGLPPKPDTGRADTDNVAYLSEKRGDELRGQRDDGIKGAGNDCTLDGTLSVEQAGAEMGRQKSGPALALKTYLEEPRAQRLEWLTKAVLHARGVDAAGWGDHAEIVRKAASDPANHPLDCECEECL
ncbi:MAG: AAA family ATPase [Actinomycetota bacterium]|nr:AAA family ATPase [Actinomycetota bacterium]